MWSSRKLRDHVENFARNSRFWNKILESGRNEKGVGEMDKKPGTRGCCSMVLLLTVWQVLTQTAAFAHTILVREGRSDLLCIPTLPDSVIFRRKITRPSLINNWLLRISFDVQWKTDQFTCYVRVFCRKGEMSNRSRILFGKGFEKTSNEVFWGMNHVQNRKVLTPA